MLDRHAPSSARRSRRIPATLLLRIATVALLGGCARPAPLALRKVVLYRNGIAYFERSGQLRGDRLRLRLRAHEVDDVLKTLTVIDRSAPGAAPVVTTRVQAAPSTAGQSADAKAAERARTVWLDIGLGKAGTHDLQIAYAVPAPVWKPAYRLVLTSGDSERALLQGWAMVNNASGDDWHDVRMELTTGAPLSFAVDLRTPQFVERPTLLGGMVEPAARGPVFGPRTLASEADRDHDRIADAVDACPDEAETFNGNRDEDGCPDRGRVIVHKARIEILDKIYFGDGEHRVQPISRPILDAVAASLRGNPQITLVDVQGHAAAGEDDPFGLSSRRARTVRDYLVQQKVAPSHLRAIGAGDTQPVGSEADRNRRVEFIIVRRDDGDSPPAGSLQAGALARRMRAAGQRVVAGSTRYAVAARVSIPRDVASMVAVINRRVDAREVLLYRPTAALAGSDRHPQRAASLQNAGKATLEPGPVAIFARGSFVGDGLLRRTHAGERTLLPFALDRSTVIRREVNEQQRPARLIAIADGVATVEDQRVRSTRYTIEAGADVPRTLVIAHPRTEGYEAIDLPPGSRATVEGHAVTLPIHPRRRSVLELRERQPVRRRIALLEDDDRVELYLSGGALPAALASTLRTIAKQRRDLARGQRERRRLARQIETIDARATELRKSLKAIEKTRRAGRLRAELLARLQRALRERDGATTELATRELAQRRTKDALAAAVAALTLPANGS